MIALLIHISIALSSIVYATLAYLAPSKNKLNTSYALVALTIASGTYLVVSTHAPMLSTCMTGLFYLCIVSVALVAARFKLASLQEEQ